MAMTNAAPSPNKKYNGYIPNKNTEEYEEPVDPTPQDDPEPQPADEEIDWSPNEHKTQRRLPDISNIQPIQNDRQFDI